MINKFLIDIMIWIDYFIMIQIMKQMILINSFINKLNLHLIRTSQHCFQFCLNIWHQSDWLNIISDMLLCLLNKITNSKNQSFRNTLENINNEIHIYHIIMIKMSFNFQNKIKKVYLKDKKKIKENYSIITLFWKKFSRHISVFLFYEWRFNLLF